MGGEEKEEEKEVDEEVGLSERLFNGIRVGGWGARTQALEWVNYKTRLSVFLSQDADARGEGDDRERGVGGLDRLSSSLSSGVKE